MQEVLTDFAERLDPAHTAVIVIDMQNDFCAEGGHLHSTRGADMSGNPALAQRIMALVEAARGAGALVIWIQANYEPRHLSPQALLKRQLTGRDDICCEGGTWGYDFFQVTPADGEPIIEKHTYSGFAGTELDRMLRFRGIKSLVFTGVSTNVCVESTLRDGYFNGYYIFMPEDCVAAGDPDLQAATVKIVQSLLGEVPQSGEVIAVWRKAGDLRAAE